jgi:hypothetical protein
MVEIWKTPLDRANRTPGWKPMLRWLSGLSSDVSEPFREFSWCTRSDGYFLTSGSRPLSFWAFMVKKPPASAKYWHGKNLFFRGFLG